MLGYREDIAEILAGSACSVDASYRGLGLTGTLRESLAVATPVVATAMEGNPELVIDGETGLLFPPRDVPALARAIERVMTNPAEGRLLRTSAYQLEVARGIVAGTEAFARR